MGGKSGPSGTTTSTSNTAPWAPQQPFLQDIFSRAQSLYGNNQPQYYPGATFAGPTGWQNEALQRIANFGAAPGGSPVTNPALMTTNEFLTGGHAAQDPAMEPLRQLATSNVNGEALAPYLSGQRMQAGNPYMRGLTDSIFAQVQPRIQSQFIQGGALNSPEAARATSEGVTSALAQPMFQQYQQEAQNQLAAQQQAASQRLQGAGALQGAFGQNAQQMLTALGLAPGAQQMPYADLAQVYGAGATQQQQQQQGINDAVQRWNYQQTLPFQALNQYIGQVTGNYGGTTTATQPYFNNQASQGMGALAGAGLGSLLGSAGGATGGAMGGMMSSIGQMLPFALMMAGSDRRLKEDIKRIDTLDNGLPLYAFRYIGEPMVHIGVMADEVETVHPEAVIVGISGLAIVDYAKAMN